MRSLLPLLLIASVAGPAHAASGRFVVVVDPGHGGTQLGARSAAGVLEKHVTLRLARMVKQALDAEPGIQVVFTRSTDELVLLSERVRRANGHGGQLFLSLHCNASPDRTQRGFEAYVLSPRSLDGLARPTAPAAGRTAAGILDGSTAPGMEVAAALADLTHRGRRTHATRFGLDVLAGLGRVLGPALNRGLQQADFDVLRGLAMPGVLVEVGFLDHAAEGALLGRDPHLRRLARVLAAAVVATARAAGMQRRAAAQQGAAPAPRSRAPGGRPEPRNRRGGPTPGQAPAAPRRPELAAGDVQPG
jgi:N-acetylmuramoyl-L-alanine amidase